MEADRMTTTEQNNRSEPGTGAEGSPCTICRSAETRPFRWGTYHLNLAPPLEVVRCLSCGLLYMSPRPDEKTRSRMLSGIIPKNLSAYGRRTAEYVEADRTRATLFRDRLAEVGRLLPDAAHPMCILDIGTSGGTFLSEAQALGHTAVGLEPAMDGALVAASRGLYVCGGVAEQLPFPSNTFDLVHAHHVFEHLSDPLAAVIEAHRVLKPGGLIYVEVPNQLANIMFLRDRIFRRISQRPRDKRSIHHLWFFSQPTLRLLFERGGLARTTVSNGYGAAWPPKGRRKPVAYATRAVGTLIGGGPFVRAYGWKL